MKERKIRRDETRRDEMREMRREKIIMKEATNLVGKCNMFFRILILPMRKGGRNTGRCCEKA